MQTILNAKKEPKKSIKLYVVVITILIFASLAVANAISDKDVTSVLSKDIITGTVTLGTLVQDVRAPGNLVSNNRQWLSAQVSAKVIKRVLEPGAAVTPDSIILILASPDLVQNYKQALLSYKVAQAQLEALIEVQATQIQQQKANVSLLEVEKQQAIEDAVAKKQLRVIKIISVYQYNEAVLREKKLTLQLRIAQFELAQLPKLQTSLLKVEHAKVEQQQLQVDLLTEQVALLNVRAGMYGILQSIAVEAGQEISKGAELARVADQENLKAELRVQESQVKDIQLGQLVQIDTRRSKITGTVIRIDPAVLNGTVTVDVRLPKSLPSEARPDLRVNGVIEIERLEQALLITKPAYWKNAKRASFYKLTDENHAQKVQVSIGSSSVSSLQILSGLKQGERIVLSDLSHLHQHENITIN